ncbi:hypothetical protein AGMMS49944_12860 [Spirochaetia bacterium]|nr:hypothetical protein AGMMS49944_12860 [Spirochaetia bacterium]
MNNDNLNQALTTQEDEEFSSEFPLADKVMRNLEYIMNTHMSRTIGMIRQVNALIDTDRDEVEDD